MTTIQTSDTEKPTEDSKARETPFNDASQVDLQKMGRYHPMEGAKQMNPWFETDVQSRIDPNRPCRGTSKKLQHVVRSWSQLFPHKLLVRHIHGPHHGHQLRRTSPACLWLDPYYYNFHRHRSFSGRTLLRHATPWRPILLGCNAFDPKMVPPHIIRDRVDCMGGLNLHLREHCSRRGQPRSWLYSGSPPESVSHPVVVVSCSLSYS